MRRRFLSLIGLITALCLLLAGCVFDRPPEDPVCRVILSRSYFYTCADAVKNVQRGSDVSFAIVLADGYAVSDVSYGDSTLTLGKIDPESGTTSAVLTLHKVLYPVFVELTAEHVGKAYTVSLAPSRFFRCEEPEQTVREGRAVQFTLWFASGYTFASCDYAGTMRADGADSDPNEAGERKVTLTLEDVRASSTVTVTECEADGGIVLIPSGGIAKIAYAFNGGSYLDPQKSGTYLTVNESLPHGYRPNASIGTDLIAREGYVQTGWNTSQRGDGTHVGLGSRVPVRLGEAVVLYAEWAKCADDGLFSFTLIERGDMQALYSEKKDKAARLQTLHEAARENLCAVITAYTGPDTERLVFPRTLNGYPVAAVMTGAVEDLPSLRTVVFPESFLYIAENSFAGCPSLAEMYLFDSLRNIDYNAFGRISPIRTLHINAAVLPVFGGEENAQLANKLELMIAENDPKIVFFGSCSTWYGVNAAQFSSAVKVPAYNLGVIGGTCALYQIDLIRCFIREGDTLVYLVETGSEYQVLIDFEFDLRVYETVENNYDLIGMLDLSRYDKVLFSLNEFLITKYNQLSKGYGDTYANFHLYYMTERGDLNNFRGNSFAGDTKGYTPVGADKLKAGKAFERFKTEFDAFSALGVGLYFGFGPLNESVIDAETANSLDRVYAEEFEAKGIPAKLLGKFSDWLYPQSCFYDTHYHLSSMGSEIFTKDLIKAYQAQNA